MKRFFAIALGAILLFGASFHADAQIVTPASVKTISLMQGPNWSTTKLDTVKDAGSVSMKKVIPQTAQRIAISAVAVHSTGTTTLKGVIRASNDGTNFYPVNGGTAADTFDISSASGTSVKIFDIPSTVGVRKTYELLWLGSGTQSTPVQGIIDYVQ